MKEHNRMPKDKEEYHKVKIGIWCNNQKQDYKNNKLSNERKQKLETIPKWTWGEKKTYTLTYDENCKILQDFVKEHKRLPKYTEEYQGVNIGIWYTTQKQNYKNGKMSNERKLKLEAIQGWIWGKNKKNEKCDTTVNLNANETVI